MLVVEDLHHQYGSQTVLNGLSFRLAQGEICLLVGQNGAGKSTLLRCIAGWTKLNRGQIRVNDISVLDHDRDYRKQVIFTPDTPDFYDELTAWEHLQLVAQTHHLSSWQTTGENLLRQFQLFDHKDTFPFTFSRGMRYKLALCLALLVRPPLLLLDEPFGPLDALASQVLWQALKEYTARGGTTLFSSHTLSANDRPDTILLLAQGQTQSIQPTDATDLAELLNHEA